MELGDQGGNGESREWLLECGGMTVDATDRIVGHVVEPLYEPSARWDRPWALAVQSEQGLLAVPFEAVRAVDTAERRIRLDRATTDLRAPADR